MSVKIAVMVGSVRRGSFNRMLAALATERLRTHGAEVTLVDLEAFDLPIYSHVIEAQAFPAQALALKRLLQAQDGHVVVSPEYNGSIPALLKNAIDWASRPTDGEGPVALSAFRGKTAAIMSASISPFGGLRALAHLRQILGTIQMTVIAEQVMIPFADRAFEVDGTLKDAMPASLLDGLAARMVDVTGRLSRP